MVASGHFQRARSHHKVPPRVNGTHHSWPRARRASIRLLASVPKAATTTGPAWEETKHSSHQPPPTEKGWGGCFLPSQRSGADARATWTAAQSKGRAPRSLERPRSAWPTRGLTALPGRGRRPAVVGGQSTRKAKQAAETKAPQPLNDQNSLAPRSRAFAHTETVASLQRPPQRFVRRWVVPSWPPITIAMSLILTQIWVSGSRHTSASFESVHIECSSPRATLRCILTPILPAIARRRTIQRGSARAP